MQFLGEGTPWLPSELKGAIQQASPWNSNLWGYNIGSDYLRYGKSGKSWSDDKWGGWDSYDKAYDEFGGTPSPPPPAPKSSGKAADKGAEKGGDKAKQQGSGEKKDRGTGREWQSKEGKQKGLRGSNEFHTDYGGLHNDYHRRSRVV